jgi:two-component system response regulator
VQSAKAIKKEINLRFGSNVRRFRHEHGISQEALAERAGLDRTYISHVERGARNVSLSSIDKLANALEVPVSTLLSESSEGVAGPCGLGVGAVALRYPEILLADGNPKDVELTLRGLERARIANRVQVASSAAELVNYLFGGVNQAAAGAYSRLILLDLSLPKGGGLSLLRRIRSDPRTRDSRVVMLATSGQARGLAEALRQGALAWIKKPFTPHSLNEVSAALHLRWLLLDPV